MLQGYRHWYTHDIINIKVIIQKIRKNKDISVKLVNSKNDCFVCIR